MRRAFNMNKWYSSLGCLVLCISSVSANAYVTCDAKITLIQPHKSNGYVYFKFDDGTAVQGTENDSGLQRNLSVALSALMANRKVRIFLNDGQACGVNAGENWTYIGAIQG